MVKRTERGWAGHFILAGDCLFRRNTLLELDDKKIIVSTVGGYKNNLGKIDTIGYKRWYETMAFEAIYQNEYWDADVSKEIHFDSEWGVWGDSWDEITEKYLAVDNVANDMHETVVEEIINKMENGTLEYVSDLLKGDN